MASKRHTGRAIAQAVSHRFPTTAARVRAQVRSCGIYGRLGQVFSEYFGFPCIFSFHRLLHIHRRLSSGEGTIGQLVTDVSNGLGLTPPKETKERGGETYGYNIFLVDT
jgi:hypothetical protein